MNATVQADFGASWYAGTAAGAFERPRLTFDIDVDVCVIGGGLAGATAASEVARRTSRGPGGRPAGMGGRGARGEAGRGERVRPQLRCRHAGIWLRPPPYG